MAVTPKAAFCVRVRLRSAASYQMIEGIIATAKGARIQTFICGRSLNDSDVPNGDAASLLQIDGSKYAGDRYQIKIAYLAPRRLQRTKGKKLWQKTKEVETFT
jgi:hypothetical protein